MGPYGMGRGVLRESEREVKEGLLGWKDEGMVEMNCSLKKKYHTCYCKRIVLSCFLRIIVFLVQYTLYRRY